MGARAVQRPRRLLPPARHESAGFAEFHRYFSAECDRDALIVDLRYNRGGHVSQLLLEKIARKRIGYDLSRWMKPSPYPDEAVAGPVVALTNEHAGSDGDIFSHSFKLMGLGPAGRHAHLGRRRRHLAAAHAGRRHARPRSPSSRSGSRTSASASRTTAPIRRSRSTTRRRTRATAATASSRWRSPPRSISWRSTSPPCPSSATSRSSQGSRCPHARDSALLRA